MRECRCPNLPRRARRSASVRPTSPLWMSESAMRTGFGSTRTVVFLAASILLPTAGCTGSEHPEEPDDPAPAEVQDAGAVDDADPEPAEGELSDGQADAATGGRAIEMWELSSQMEFAVGSNPGSKAFVHHDSLLLRSGSAGVNV